LWVIPNIEVFALDERMPVGSGKIPEVPAYCTRDYGARVGVWRIMEVLEHYAIRATVALNSEVCDAYPQIIEEATKLRWEFMGHNQSNTRRLNQIPAEDERRVIHDSLVRIEQATGKKPVGWLSSGLQETWETLDYLTEEGLRYVADWVNDDQPYLMNINGKRLVSIPYSFEINDIYGFVEQRRTAEEGLRYVADWVNDDQPYLMNINGKRLVSIPYSFEINDIYGFVEQRRTAEEFDEMIRRQFDVLYREGASSGRVMAIAVHPYIIGMPYRIDAFRLALGYICAHKGVWLATGAEIVDHYLSSGVAA
jgi:peptidoglycan/xylan/chitin deacetylase (PgdA/CDA1 family)